MKTVHAIFTDGVFRPTEQVELPERCEVEFEPRPVAAQNVDAALGNVNKILSERYTSDEPDIAEQHDHHQP